MKRLFTAIVAITLFLSGCGKDSSTTDEREPGIVDYITGSEQLKTYKRTRSKIESINKDLRQRNSGF